MSIDKKLRQRVLEKYNFRCAYCGKVIDFKGFQVDHLRPKCTFAPDDPKRDCFDNLMPSCRRCNHYKRSHTLWDYRRLVETLHTRVAKQYITNVAIDYGIVTIKEWDGIFYFERV